MRDGMQTAGLAGIFAAVILAGCSGGGSGDETISVKLTSDRDCYGFSIEVDQAGLSESELGTIESCTPDPALTALGCETGATSTANRYGLTAGGCFAPDGTALFRCTVPRALADRFRTSAQLRCGCGCAAECPTSTGATVCDEDGSVCDSIAVAVPEPARATSVVASVQSTPAIARETTVASSTTYCGTCCDAQDIDTGVKLSSEGAVREIRFDLAMNIDEPSCPEFNGCTVATAFDGPSRLDFDGDGIHVCLSAKNAVAGPAHLLSCSVNSDGSDEYEIANVSALDRRFRDAVPAPTVVNDFGAP